ncbi:peptide ligase PGM1-related protein [Streptomyces sp. NPDC057101]|uniref:preATP grasp domain-containing protein n=1 Tax=Streptomyces sp. NPDC057101 TaxID=3346020 RepID=UPI003637065B
MGNCNSEYMVDRLEDLDPGEREATPVVASRMVWLLRDGDALVLPQPVDAAYVAHVGSMMGFDPARVELLAPGDRAVRVLSQEVLHGPELLASLKKLVAVSSEWEIAAYLSDRGIDAVAREIGLDQGAVGAFDAAGGAELFNSKVVFRALAAGLGVPVPDGAVCATRGDLERALERLAASTGAVIVKADRMSGGVGNVLCSVDPEMATAGAAGTLPLTGQEEREAILAHTGLAATHAPHGQVVVETYHPGCRSLCLEVHCPGPRSGPPRLLNIGEMLMEPVWNGFVMPAQNVPDLVLDEVVGHTLRLAQAMSDFGYRGLVNIDAIIAPDGRLWFNEVNARLGGCTHLHHLATTLLGPHWQHKHVLVSHNDLAVADLGALLHAMDRERLTFNPATGTGVVITGDATLHHGTAEYAALAPDLHTAQTLEKQLRNLAP